MRCSCFHGCERVFYIAGCRRGVVLNGFLNIGRALVGTALAVWARSPHVGGCRRLSVGFCGRLLWDGADVISYVRLPRAPPFLQCCHGNRSGSLLLEVLCGEEEPTWRRTAVRTQQTQEREKEKLSLCCVSGSFIEPGRRIIPTLWKSKPQNSGLMFYWGHEGICIVYNNKKHSKFQRN